MIREKTDAAELVRRLNLGPGPGSNLSELYAAASDVLLPGTLKGAVVKRARHRVNALIYAHSYHEAAHVLRETVFPKWGIGIMNGPQRKFLAYLKARSRNMWRVVMTPPKGRLRNTRFKRSIGSACTVDKDLARAYLHALLIAQQIKSGKKNITI